MTFSKPRKIKQAREKRWEVVVSLRGRRVRRYFLTEKKAQGQIGEWRRSVGLGMFAVDFPGLSGELGFAQEGGQSTQALRWQTAREAYRVDCVKRELRGATIKEANSTIRRAGEFLGNPSIKSVTREDVVRYITTKGKTEKSRKSIRSCVCAFLNWCGKRKFCERGKFLRLEWDRIIKDKERPVYLSVEEVRNLFEFAVVMKPGCNQSSAEINVKKSLQFRAALGCAVFLGLRPGVDVPGVSRYGELPLLQRKHFQLQERVLVVPSRVSKTRVERRIYDVPANLLEAVGVAGYQAEDFILPGNYEWFQKRLYKIRKEVEGAGLPQVTWCQKILRHTFGTYAVHRGNSRWAIEAGRWQDPKVMETHYVNNAEPEQAAAFWALEFAELPERWMSTRVKKELGQVKRGFALREQAEIRKPITEYLSEKAFAELAGLVGKTGFSQSKVLELAIGDLARSYE